MPSTVNARAYVQIVDEKATLAPDDQGDERYCFCML